MLKKKIFIYAGLMFVILALFVGIKTYSYQSESALANSLETTRHYIDSLDGEIEDPTNPDITVAGIAEASTELPTENIGPNTSTEKPKVVEAKREGPDSLLIDKLGINAYVQHVGLARSGNMAVPTNYKDVGWYKLGAEPGEKGNAVIAGHLDNSLGLPGVFKNLNNLQAGDLIKVKDSSGTVLTFKVTHKKTYAYNNTDTREVFEGGEKSRLVLITCSGSWISGERSYSDRLAVFAELI